MAFSLECFFDLGTIQHRRAIDTSISDTDEIMIVEQVSEWINLHIGNSRSSFKPKNWLSRVFVDSMYSNYRKLNQTRICFFTVLRNDKRAEISLVTCGFRFECAAFQN